jgi:NAD(P)-dependent dehydrogenase (short-subunit alcohol dehydrogenase family)
MNVNEQPVALIVGAGDFIGSAIAKRFAAGDYTVAAGRRTADKLAPLVAEIESAGGRAAPRRVDFRARSQTFFGTW